MGNKPPSFAPSDNPASDSSSILTRFQTFTYLPAFNFGLLLYPATLSFDWSMKAIPLLESITDPRNLWTFSFYSGLLVSLDMCLVHFGLFKSYSGFLHLQVERKVYSFLGMEVPAKSRSNDLTSKSYLLSIALLALPFLPATNLLFYVGFVVAERVLYIPSMGFCLAVSIGAERIWERLRTENRKRAFVGLCIALLVLFCGRTIRRNADWQTEEQLYKSGIPVNPAKVGYFFKSLAGTRRPLPATETPCILDPLLPRLT
eukprot:m.170275 g.170275  ORF g.170275 m.170275 type:complete len:259 (+) comp39035_c0_seq13:151-927(+)